MEPQPPLPSAGCPRCGTRIETHFKFCPHCAYRLLPDLVRVEHPAEPHATKGERVLSLGGYLLFTSLLLLVALAGIQLFAQRPSPRTSARRLLVPARDPDARTLDPARDFVRVGSGTVLLGVSTEQTPPVESLLDDPFQLARYEVTNDQYYEFLLDAGTKLGTPVPETLIPASWVRRTGEPLLPWTYPRGRGNLPVVGVTYRAAMEFCAWFWETRLDADPSRIADLPTVLEFVRAGRRDRVEDNFPWGREEEEGKANLWDQLLDVDDPRVGEYDGIFALVGNAAEWIHDEDERGAGIPTAAGWSFAREGTAGSGEELVGTPFAHESMLALEPDDRRLDLGFRVVIRDAPALPLFVPVAAGTARFPDPEAETYLRVDQEYLEFLRRTGEVPPPDGETPTVEEPPPEPVGDGRNRFPKERARVATAFEMARTEVTNHQYLYFVQQVAGERGPERMLDLVPGHWNRPHPLRARANDSASELPPCPFAGPLGTPVELPPDVWSGRETRYMSVYAPGEENLPVRGVTPQQARDYAMWLSMHLKSGNLVCRLPTVSEFLLAGRGEGTDPYPWGTSPRSTLLVCEGFRTSENRPVSLLGRFGEDAPPLVGLSGNLLEWVTDGVERGDPVTAPEWLLAGGCYALPPEGCTLDSILDSKWLYERPNGSVFDPEPYTGFRVVRVPTLP